MKAGDMVRFRKPVYPIQNRNDCGIWDWKLGLLVKYESWEKIATVLHNGKLLRIRAEYVQKAGRKDGLE